MYCACPRPGPPMQDGAKPEDLPIRRFVEPLDLPWNGICLRGAVVAILQHAASVALGLTVFNAGDGVVYGVALRNLRVRQAHRLPHPRSLNLAHSAEAHGAPIRRTSNHSYLALSPGVNRVGVVVPACEAGCLGFLHVEDKYAEAPEGIVTARRDHVVVGQFLPWLA